MSKESSPQMGMEDSGAVINHLTYSCFFEDDTTLLGSTKTQNSFKSSSPIIPKCDSKPSQIEIPFRPDFQRKGTFIVKYHPTSGFETIDDKDQCVQFKSITAMIEYGQKSFEELRFEDLTDKQVIHDSCKIISDILMNYFNNSNDSGFNDSKDVQMERNSKKVLFRYLSFD